MGSRIPQWYEIFGLWLFSIFELHGCYLESFGCPKKSGEDNVVLSEILAYSGTWRVQQGYIFPGWLVLVDHSSFAWTTGTWKSTSMNHFPRLTRSLRWSTDGVSTPCTVRRCRHTTYVDGRDVNLIPRAASLRAKPLIVPLPHSNSTSTE
jgi:hypothetical protein